MYADLPLWLSLAFMAAGLAALAWSSGFFVDGAAALAEKMAAAARLYGRA